MVLKRGSFLITVQKAFLQFIENYILNTYLYFIFYIIFLIIYIFLKNNYNYYYILFMGHDINIFNGTYDPIKYPYWPF